MLVEVILLVFSHTIFPTSGYADSGEIEHFAPPGSSRSLPAGPSCWYPLYRCSITPENLISWSVISGDEVECYENCKNSAGASCQHFTFWTMRGLNFCYLLKQCNEEHKVWDDWCLASGSCASGPRDCAGRNSQPGECERLIMLGGKQWNCEDGTRGWILSGYKNPVPGLGFCYQKCNSWTSKRWNEKAIPKKKGFLRSQCQVDGSWGAVEPNDVLDGETSLLYPPLTTSLTAYPKPDQEGLHCDCAPLTLIWPTNAGHNTYWTYNPRHEGAASMQCGNDDGREELGNDVPYDLDSKKEFTIRSGMMCQFFCDDLRLATVTCRGGQWTGDPEYGFWCYQQPQIKNALKFVNPNDYN